MRGKKIIVTAGPTREQIDPVRFISNNSSGKMGYSLAEAAFDLGAEVTLITGPTNLESCPGVKVINILSTSDLYRAVKREFKKADILIMAAAPADFKPVSTKKHKIKKSNAVDNLTLAPTVDILNEIKSLKKKSQFVVGFALETDDPVANARKKLKEKSLDMIVVNQPTDDSGFDSDTNRVTVLAPEKRALEIPLATKQEISYKLLDLIASML